MKEKILNFLNEGKPLLWIKGQNFHEIENIIVEGLNAFENKRYYIYEKGTTINRQNNSVEVGMGNLFTTLDELYPQGIRKVPIFLLIKDSLAEIVDENNLEYIKEIVETKIANPKYNFTLIVVDQQNTVPEDLREIASLVDDDEQKRTAEMALKKAILDITKIEKIELDLAKLEKIELDLDSIEKIVQSLKDDIKKITVGEKPAELKPTFEDMVFVKGGKYQPSFTDEEKEVSNLEVSKYLITQKLWQELIRNNPANFKGDENRPIEYISWWHALEFCNRLSEKYGLRPVYNLGKSDQGLLMINQLDGTVVSPDVADFNKTEGFRLPTEVEWEWFARGGQVALDNGTFDYTYSGSNNIDDVAWYTGNSKDTTQSVGLKMPNVLGLYDCNGNVWEWCYDTTESIESGKSYVYKAYDHSNVYRRLKGGSWCNNTEVCAVAVRGNSQATYAYSNAGFRIVRTVL